MRSFARSGAGFSRSLIVALGFSSPVAGPPSGQAAEPGRVVQVRTTEQLRAAVQRAGPGTRIVLASGTYQGPIYSERLKGTADRPIVIEGADPKRKPLIRGGGEGMKLSDPAHVEVRDLIFEGADGIGVHIDDGGSYETPAHDIALIGLEVRGSGLDGIKLTGVDRFRIEQVQVRDWRDRNWCGMNLLGCHDGAITACRISGRDDWGFGIQLKGGCRQVAIRGCRFDHAGTRALQIGGSTGLDYFRPPLRGLGTEARGIVVEHNLVIGSEASVAFASSEDVTVRWNTFYRPRQWLIRILRENAQATVATARSGYFTDNLVAFRSGEMTEAVNIGRGTEPETFRFARNWWYCLDRPGRSKPDLPTAERGGTVGRDPMFEDAEGGNLRPKADSPARKVGAFATPGDKS